jgi:SAM-dependent methyltransferase
MNVSDSQNIGHMDQEFLKEYSAEEAIRKYTRETAGAGISYLLEHEYGKIYLDALEKSLSEPARQTGVRILEFGCGGGMNLLHLASTLERRGIAVQCAYGADFSPKLIDAANAEAKRYLSPMMKEKVRFSVARNETLAQDLANGLGVASKTLLGSFHLILGVNTFRYCQRLKTDVVCARAIFNLLEDGGICVMIDMNNRFPLFRSRFRDHLMKEKELYYLPSLDEYAKPFSAVGFDIIQKGNFCWIPHSAGPRLTSLLRKLTPMLNSVARNHAMRSLVISRKPGRLVA